MKFDDVKRNLINEPKTWLVTGCAGFIGSNLCETLLKLNQKVLGVDNFSTGYKHNLVDIKDSVSDKQWNNFSFIEGDISSYDLCLEVTRGVDIILNQAALGSVPRSIDNPINSNKSNVTGFLNMLTAAKENNIKRFVYASSSSVYGDSKELPKVEERTGNLLSPYSVTKYANELYASVFAKCYDIEPIGLRYFNVFGRRQNANGAYAAVIPKWVGALLNNEDVFINGDGETSRDFTYIENVIQANILAGTTSNENAYGEVFNIAAGGRETLNNLFNLIKKELTYNISDVKIKDVKYRDFRAGDIRHSNAKISKARDLIGYSPSHNLKEGLKESIQWYVNNIRGESNEK